jgi:Winged helix DNA-binding domain
MKTITVAQRRARIAIRHHLARPARTVEDAAADLVGLHSSDPATVYLSAWARVKGFAVGDLERALYEERSLVRILGNRRTLFVVPRDQAAVVVAAYAKVLAAQERRRLVGLLRDQVHAADPEGWLERVRAETLAALEARGEADARALTRDVPDLGTRLTLGEGKTWGGTMGVSTRMLFLLTSEAIVVRGRPKGAWTSGQYLWAPMDAWLGEPLPHIPAEQARAELVRRYLRSFGPVTETDVRWWTGWTARQARDAIADIGAVEVGLEDGGTGLVLPDDLRAVRAPAGWVAFLPSLDPTVMGWKERDWYLGPHGPALFDRNGNAGPTVWAGGRVVGGWGQGEDARVRVRLLEDVPATTRRAIETERRRLEDWLDGVRIRARFPTPLGRELEADP